MCSIKWAAIRGSCAMDTTICPNPEACSPTMCSAESPKQTWRDCRSCRGVLRLPITFGDLDGLSDTVVNAFATCSSWTKPTLTIPC